MVMIVLIKDKYKMKEIVGYLLLFLTKMNETKQAGIN